MSQQPSPEDVQRYAARAGIPVDEETATAFAEQFAQQDLLLEGLEALAPPEPPERDHWEPTEADDPLAAFLTRCDVSESSGPLDGMTVGVKDNLAVAGVPMTCGSPVLESYVPEFDATVVERLLDAGARIVGKTNMDELAFGGEEATMRLRLAGNPHDPDRHPGSSSAGSGIVAATGEVDLAVGSDTGGSIRFPAAWSGAPGIKPTRGLVSHHGFVQYAKTLDNVGLLAPTVENLARGLDVIAGRDDRDERTRGAEVDDYAAAVEAAAGGTLDGLTIGLPEELFGNAPDLDEVTRDALDRLEADGAELVEVSIPDYDLWLPAWLALGMTEVGNYFRANATNHWLFSEPWPSLNEALQAGFEESGDELGATFVGARLYAEHLSKATGDRYYSLAHAARQRLTAGVDDALADVDVLASTTVPMLAPKWGEGVGDVFGALANTAPFNVSGHPAVSVPCGTVDDLPVGLQFVGEHFDEATILATATHWSDRYDWAQPSAE
ncbi:amidase family protein [Halobacterium wangiae]|uniref:amidase family protein n=1 Tax=Halobacterium wangiae TaxID=2902623 RepID=UPI001E34232E|nr:amidase family protein [Halobacterium wangiae]